MRLFLMFMKRDDKHLLPYFFIVFGSNPGHPTDYCRAKCITHAGFLWPSVVCFPAVSFMVAHLKTDVMPRCCVVFDDISRLAV